MAARPVSWQVPVSGRRWTGDRGSGTIIGGGLFPLAATAILAGMHQSWPIAAIMGGCSMLGLFSLGLARERRAAPAPEAVMAGEATPGAVYQKLAAKDR
jgi:hypothetical protein